MRVLLIRRFVIIYLTLKTVLGCLDLEDIDDAKSEFAVFMDALVKLTFERSCEDLPDFDDIIWSYRFELYSKHMEDIAGCQSKPEKGCLDCMRGVRTAMLTTLEEILKEDVVNCADRPGIPDRLL